MTRVSYNLRMPTGVAHNNVKKYLASEIESETLYDTKSSKIAQVKERSILNIKFNLKFR